MELPSILRGESLVRLLQGAVAGFFATAIIGFNWGGWMLESTANQMAEKAANSAVVTALAPICADKFRQATDSTLNMVELKKVSSWMQDSYIEKGGWATFAGGASPERRGPGLREPANRPEISTDTHAESGCSSANGKNGPVWPLLFDPIDRELLMHGPNSIAVAARRTPAA